MCTHIHKEIIQHIGGVKIAVYESGTHLFENGGQSEHQSDQKPTYQIAKVDENR